MNIVNALKAIGSRAHGYGPRSIPCPLDDEISILIDDWKKLPPNERIAEASGIRGEPRDILLAYGERMASKAVRAHSREDFFNGLLAIGMDGWNNDWRENLMLMALYYDAAVRIKVSLDDLIDDASEFMSLKTSSAFRAFMKRSEEDKTLTAMGYEPSKDNEGFRYRRNW